MLNSKQKKEIRKANGFASPSVQEFEKIVQRAETNKLLTYYNKHKHVLARGTLGNKQAKLEKTPDH